MNNSSKQKRPDLEREVQEFLIDDALARSTKLRRISKRIRRAQQVLRGLCDDPAWDAYLKIEEATNARAGKELRLVLKKCVEVFGYAIFESRRARPP